MATARAMIAWITAGGTVFESRGRLADYQLEGG
jgi:hypothetical protein